MATERERLFDLLLLERAEESKRKDILQNQILRAESGMTAEEVAHVRERVAKANV